MRGMEGKDLMALRDFRTNSRSAYSMAIRKLSAAAKGAKNRLSTKSAPNK
jgi:hypothetical protein